MSGWNIKESVIPIGNGAILYEFWNLHTIQKYHYPKLYKKVEAKQGGEF